MIQLHETIMGRRLIEHTLPEIAKALQKIAERQDFIELTLENSETIVLNVNTIVTIRTIKVYDTSFNTLTKVSTINGDIVVENKISEILKLIK